MKRRYPLVVLCLLFVSALAVGAVAGDQPPSADFTEVPDVPEADDDYVIVSFTEPPAATHDGDVPGHDRTRPHPGDRLDPRAEEVRAYVADLRGHQEEFRTWLADRHPQAEVVAGYQLVANAVAVRRDGVSDRQLQRGPGVDHVQPSAWVRPTMNASVDLIAAPELWQRVPGGREDAGEGVDVAIVDSGIDFGHPLLGCKDAGDAVQRLYYSGELPDHVLPPAPEAAPEGMWTDHGTHVAGSVAGCVATVAPEEQWSGVAPGAAVHDYNVFPARGVGYAHRGGSALTHDIVAALEDALVDGMHVVNMSLGGAQQGPNDLLEQASDALVEAGVTVVTSAGNSGPAEGTVTSPASAEQVISVGASTNSQILGVQVEVDADDPEAADPMLAAIGSFGPETTTVGALTDWADHADGDTLACEPIAEGTLDDEIALVERGACPFTDKVRNAEAAGAGGVLMYNDVAGPPVAPVHDGTEPMPQIPSVMVSDDDGATLRGLDAAQVTLPPAGEAALWSDDAFANVLAGFSSRGPTPHGDRLKPDVVAPGVNILSTVFDGGLALFQGTSMAAPHVAGAAAALHDLRDDWGPADVKSALVTTADPGAVTDHLDGEHDPGLLHRGAGLVDLAAASQVPVTLDPATVDFGAWRGNRPVDDEQPIEIRNVTGGELACDVALTGPEVASVSQEQISLDRGEGTSVAVSLDAGNHRDTGSGDYDGRLTIDCGEAGAVDAPWWVRIERP